MVSQEICRRRFDLDWLRVLAFGLLIYFHAAVAFLPDGLPMILNSEPSLVLQIFVAFLHEFRLALLFLVSGVGVRFALRQRGRRAFFVERSRRLLLPLLFGVLILVPPMVYLEKRYLGLVDESFAAFYPSFFVSGVYPRGHLSWHHFWFVAYLWLFCLLAWPLLRWLRGSSGSDRFAHWVRWLSKGHRLYWFSVPLLIVEIPLRALFPGFRDLIHDWASFSQWFLVFMAGYALALSERLLDQAQHIRRSSLGLEIGASVLLFAEFWTLGEGMTPRQDGQVEVARYLGFCLLRVANLWFWLLVCLGYAGRYLQRSNAILDYLNQAVYPLFCCHLTLLVGFEYLVLPTSWPIAFKFLVLTSATIVVNLLLYEWCIRRVRWLRPLFGLKPPT